MDKDILNRAIELKGKGLRIAQIAQQLGVNKNALRKELAESDGFDKAEIVSIVHSDEPLIKTAYDTLRELFGVMRQRIQDPLVKLGEISAAMSVCDRVYRAEAEAAGNNSDDDDNNPVTRLFNDEMKLLNEL
jgi:transposase-like protein